LRAHLDWEEGTTLVCALRSGVHLHLGFASFAEYIERMFGYKPRWTEERLRVAEALEELPALREALRDGSANWSAARELTRVATRGNEHEWLEVAKGKTLRQIEALVAGRKPGDGPHERADPSLVRHVLKFDVSADTMATQLWLAYVAGCSDAAVSFWESGKRIPAYGTLSRIVDALTQAGASPRELEGLRRAWLEVRVLRRKAKAIAYRPSPRNSPSGSAING
jgi:hypothetical protein